jgi:hypothetical protein
MENSASNGCSHPAARTGCEVGAKVREFLLSRGFAEILRGIAAAPINPLSKGWGTHVCHSRPERPNSSILRYRHYERHGQHPSRLALNWKDG